jgi:ribosome biogenesis GTPase A
MENITNINWYPGHMAKTMKEIEENLRLVDLVVIILDSRIVRSSDNPEINKLIEKKNRIYVLNKKDLSEEAETEKWISYYSSKGIPAIATNCELEDDVKKVLKLIEKQSVEIKEKAADKGRNKIIRIMIIGVPNSGKSSFINRISKRKAAIVGNRPGVTRQKQWIRLEENLELLDTPGVLWPKINNNNAALPLSFTGAIKDDILDLVEIAYELIKWMMENKYEENLKSRYDIKDEEIKEIFNSDLEENEKIIEVMNIIGRNKGCLIKGGEIDLMKVSKLVLTDFRSGKLGRITVEKVDDRIIR